MAQLKNGTTIGGNTAWHAGNDGVGSGLDADLLDGQHGSYYYSPANPPPISSGYSGQMGPMGYSGYSGISGISGFSGTDGLSGFSGWSGAAADSGYSGVSGFSGESGFSGYSGQSGLSGYSGTSGVSGYSGQSGYSGISGFSGNTGEAGTSGYSGEIGLSGYSGVSGFGLASWTKISSNTTAVNTGQYFCDTSGGSFTLTLPATPSSGDIVAIADAGSFVTNNLTVARNGSTIENYNDDLLITIGNAIVFLLYDGTTWQVYTTSGPVGVSGFSGYSGGGGGGGGSVTNDTSTNSDYYPLWSTVDNGTLSSLYVSNTKLYFNPSTGTLNATTFNSLSDINQKKDIVRIVDATSSLKKIEGVEFKWKENDKKSAGVIAQQLETILPNLVDTNRDGTKSVNYSGLIAYLIETIKELESRIETIERKVE